MNNISEEKKKKYALVISLLVLMICIVGSTYAYFAITASNNSITGKVGGSSLDLTVTKILPVDNDDEMIPQLEGGLEKAISEDYNCVDGNGKVVCQVYSATVTNLGSEAVTLNGNISFTGIENMPNLKWKLLADSRTINSEATSTTASTTEVSFVENLSLTTEETTKSSTYYFVFWIEETGELQTDNGEFRAVINFDSPNAESGVTSTITPGEEGTIATTYVQSLYDANSATSYNIGGDTSKPSVSMLYLNEEGATDKWGIMLDNNGEYRYYGKNPNNYVSFNGELWRIISSSNVKTNADDTTGSQRLRIIRAESIGNHQWDYGTDGGDFDNNWENATLNTTLNGIYYNGTSGTCYLGEYDADIVNISSTCDYSENGTIKGLSEEARSLIDDAVWYLGGNDTSSGLYASDWYNVERGLLEGGYKVYEGNPTSTTAKLGLMYPSDYAYAADLSVCIKTGVDYAKDTTNCTGTDWLFNSGYQWLISPYSDVSYYAFGVHSSGYVGYVDGDVTSALGVLPVAVLSSDVTITGGSGTSGDPYTLSIGS